MRTIYIAAIALVLSGCGGSDGDPSTYDTCKISSSGSLDTIDRVNDLNQCWSILATEDKLYAGNQCEQLVLDYMVDRYTGQTHEIEYAVSNGSCN